MKELFKKLPSGLIPDSIEASELLSKVPVDALVTVEYVQKRNYRNLKRFFALVNTTFEMQDCFDNKDIWRKHLVMLGGHYDEVVVTNPKKGTTTVQYWPKSVNFETMDEVEFKALFDKIITGYLARFGTGMTETELLKVIEFD